MTLSHAPRLLVLASLFWAVPAAAQTTEPGPEALTHLREGAPTKNVVQNRFILKEARFEFSPVAGAIPNNPMVKRLLAGMNLSYHFSEQFAANAQFVYSPDLQEKDLKGLTNTLVYIAHGSQDGQYAFQQPVDKMVLSGIFAAQWAPIYGKINLLGETILNFDLYGVVGLGMLSIQKGYARYDATSESAIPVKLEKADKESKFPLALGTGINFFVNQSVAIKMDARSLLYFDSKPDYGNEASDEEDGTRLYNNFIATAGVAFYFPKMSPRIENF